MLASTHSYIDLSEFRRRATNTVAQMRDAIRSGITQAIKEAADYARTNHLHKQRSGHLTSPAMLYGRVIRSSSRGTVGELSNVTPYARYIEEGTRAHWIRPKEGFGFIGPLQAGQSRRAKTDIGTHRIALRWYVNGQPVFARAVFHPGTSALPFMTPAADHGVLVFHQSFQRQLVGIQKMLWE